MIARVWNARVPAENAPRYRAHLEEHVLPQLGNLDGYLGAELWTRTDSGKLRSLSSLDGRRLLRSMRSQETAWSAPSSRMMSCPYSSNGAGP